MQGGGLPLCLLAIALAVVWTNIWNFMDGIDGIAASQAAIWGGALAAFAGAGPLYEELQLSTPRREMSGHRRGVPRFRPRFFPNAGPISPRARCA